jgi:hypothetical protein
MPGAVHAEVDRDRRSRDAVLFRQPLGLLLQRAFG